VRHQDVTKLCADSLRSYYNNKYGIKLKSGHAHELVAAFFGFKSRITMLAKANAVIHEWDQGELVLAAPPIPLIDQRLRTLLELPPDLSSGHTMAETVYAVLVGQLYLRRSLRKFFTSGLPQINWEMSVNIEHNDDETVLTVDVGQPVESNQRLSRYRQYVIHLSRTADGLGYETPTVEETHYSGLTRTHSDEELDRMYPPSRKSPN
jgi:hypothetical protein